MEEQHLTQEENNTEDSVEKMITRQIELSDNICATAKLLRFILQVTGKNLATMREQLVNIQTLAEEIAVSEGAADNP